MIRRVTSTGPDFASEAAALEAGLEFVCGVDEAGRGPLAGPVVAAAVVLDPARLPMGLNDSKKLSARRRDALFETIMAEARVSVVAMPPETIDRLNIRGATLWAMRAAVLGLPVAAGLALIDGRDIPDDLPCPARALIGGDGRSLSIAAASIVAKVTRDRMCPIMDVDAPGFGFAGHKGYGTAEHMECIERLGPSRHHRTSFAPMRTAGERQ
ncbi:MAG TPA: ribonuclease HII [Devosiaceae bacterium]